MPSSFLGGVIHIIQYYWPLLLRGAWTTLYISLVATIVGCVIGLTVAVIRLLPMDENVRSFKNVVLKIVKMILGIYVEFIRGTPMMVQSMFIYFGGREIGMTWSIMQASIFIVTLNTGAYAAEIMRGGIISVDSGQLEGARSIGMSHFKAMYHIIIPQAIRNALPAIGNEFVTNIKDTSVLNVIALNELFLQARTISGNTYRTPETFLVTALIYFIMTFTVTRILAYIERRYDGEGVIKNA